MSARRAELHPEGEARFWSGVAYATRFFMGDADVQQALFKLARFPDPAHVAIRGARVALVPLTVLIELKLASGLSAPHRLRDLADVLELIRAARLPATLVEELDPSVREKYRELWRAAQTPEVE